MGIYLIPKMVTLNFVMAVILHHFTQSIVFGTSYVKPTETGPIVSVTKNVAVRF